MAVEVSSYTQGSRLYVGLYSKDEDGLEPYTNLTVNLPYSPAGFGEGYINQNDSKNLLEFIERHQLGKVLPEKGYSGYCEFAKVAFDLDKLAELDPIGVEEYKCLHKVQKKGRAQKKKEGAER